MSQQKNLSKPTTLIASRYRLIASIGMGGMASIHRAWDVRLRRVVAIKQLHHHLAESEKIRRRFQIEAQVIARINHPNIVRVYDYSGFETKAAWIVMEYLSGMTLSRYTERFPNARVPVPKALVIFHELAKAVQYIHNEGVIHRDIKLENAMLLKDGHLKLMDFGIARRQAAESLTAIGEFLGSPSYMSPEQIRGHYIDHRTDIYSLGIVLFRLLAGRFPFEGQTPQTTCQKILDGDYRLPPNIYRDASPTLIRILTRCLASSAEQRYPSITELMADLRDVLHKNRTNHSSSTPNQSVMVG